MQCVNKVRLLNNSLSGEGKYNGPVGGGGGGGGE